MRATITKCVRVSVTANTCDNTCDDDNTPEAAFTIARSRASLSAADARAANRLLPIIISYFIGKLRSSKIGIKLYAPLTLIL